MQKAFDQIVKKHLEKEIHETDLQDDSEEQFIENLNKCFEEKGILKELQIFLRQKLVAILKESSPEIVTSSKGTILDSSLTLFTDFIISHKLLFTYSVLCSEIEDKYQLKEELEKISNPDCETILAELGLSKDSGESQEILEFYFANEDTSLLESILHFSSIKVLPHPSLCKTPEQSKSHANANLLISTSTGESSHQNNPAAEVSEKDEKSSEVGEVSYTSIDLERIRDEIESRLRFELKDKEKELVQNFEQKLDILRKKFELEKVQWLEGQQQQHQQLKNDKMPIKELHNNCGDDLEKVVRKQVERNFLIKEAQLRSQIERLMLENKKLLGQPVTSRSSSSCHKSRHKSHHCHSHRPRSRKTSEDYENGYFERNHQSQNHQLNIDEDTIAMLQYRVECQAEEIETLKKVVSQSSQNSIKKPAQKTTSSCINDKNVHRVMNGDQNCHFLNGLGNVNVSGDSDMENFLQESKSRCEQIEKEAKVLENCLVELQMKTRSPSRSSAAAGMVFGTGSGDTLNPFNTSTYIRPIPPRIPSDLRNFSPTISDQSTSVKYQVYPSKSYRKDNKISNHTIGIERIPNPKPNKGVSHPNRQRSSRSGKYDENQHVSFIDLDHTDTDMQKPQSIPIPMSKSACDGKTFQNDVGFYPYKKDQEINGNKSSMSVIFQRNEARLGMRDSSFSDNSIVDPEPDRDENPPPKSPAVYSEKLQKCPEKKSPIKSTHEEIMEEKASVAGALLKDKLTLSMRRGSRESRESSTNSKSSAKSQSPPKSSNSKDKSSIKPRKPLNSTENQDKGQKVTKNSEIEPEKQQPPASPEKSQSPQKVQKSQNFQEPSPSSSLQDHEEQVDHHKYKVVQNGGKSGSSSSSPQSSLVILAPPPALTDVDQENFWDL